MARGNIVRHPDEPTVPVFDDDANLRQMVKSQMTATGGIKQAEKFTLTLRRGCRRCLYFSPSHVALIQIRAVDVQSIPHTAGMLGTMKNLIDGAILGLAATAAAAAVAADFSSAGTRLMGQMRT